ncbi:MAG: transglycosylase domain-containing protein [Candidatus Nanopelagicales bacterium]
MRIDYPRAGRTGIRRWLPSWKQVLSIVLLGIVSVVGAFAIAVAVTDVPEPNEVAVSQATIVYYADGTTEIGRLSDSTRVSVPLSEVPDHVQKAVLAAEDRSFYEHGGFSPVAIGRAAWNNITGGSTQGGSTITQQYAKNAYLTQDQTIVRKLKELVLSVKIEATVPKDQILEDYLNTIYFGRGAYGIEAAAKAYFGKSVSDLTVAQGAVLASIIRSPGGYAPEDNLDKLEGRWAYVLDGMVEEGWLTPAERAQLEFPKIRERRTSDRLAGQVGFMLDAVRQDLLAKGFTDTEIDGGGLKVVSTFDRDAMKAARLAVKEAGPQSETEGLRIGLAAVRPGTGEVVAFYGGRDYIDDQFNNSTQAIAQAGSTFKPFALAAGTEAGVPLDSVWNGDSPATIQGYTLNNYGGSSYGQITLLQATEDSVNTAYVELEADIGVDNVVDAALRSGVPEDTPGMYDANGQANLTFVLGTASPTALDMAGAYATFAARGAQVTPTYLRQVFGANGGLLYELSPSPESAFDSQVADTVNYALQKVVTNGTGFAAQALGRPSAGKTGTTDENKSAWYVGYTPQLATAVMMVKSDAEGNPVTLSGTGGLASVTGGSFPAQMWTSFMSAALADTPVEEFVDPEVIPSASVAPSESVVCPSVLPLPSGESLPEGCPLPTITSGEPSPTETSPTGEPTPTDTAPTGEPTPTDTAPTGPPTPTDTAPTGDPTPTDTAASPSAATSAASPAAAPQSAAPQSAPAQGLTPAPSP